MLKRAFVAAALFPLSVLLAAESGGLFAAEQSGLRSVPGAEGILQTYAAIGASYINVVEETDGTDGGVRALLSSLSGVKFYRMNDDGGLIGANDVVLIKINSQWAERGGTNTDLLKGLIEFIVSHPAGFTGEVIIADNGQGMFGSEGRGGRLDWPSPNAKDRKQSAQMVADYFAARGFKVSGVLWDAFTKRKTAEFSAGDNNDGFVVDGGVLSTGIQVSYPKFTTKYGTRVSFKMGVWDAASKSYDSKRLRLINAPVLKAHSQYHVTGAVKAYMGTPSNALTDMLPHKSVGTGGLGSLMVNTRFPTLNILDMIYICPQRGPPSAYATAVQKNMIAASTDPFALDWWAARTVLIPAAELTGNIRSRQMDPDSKEPGSFGFWLAKSLAAVREAGIPATTDAASIVVQKIYK
jgi:uncharacterized protein (DUF362 family)